MTVIGNNKHAQETIDDAHQKTHDGEHFFYNGWSDVTGAATTLDFLFHPVGVEAHARFRFYAEDEFSIVIYKAPTYAAAGTPITPRQTNDNSSSISALELYSAPTITAPGAVWWSGKVGSARETAILPEGNYELVGAPGTYYLIRMTKENVGTHYIGYDFNWYEV